MAVKIKLKRMGKIRTPQYRIVIADARTKRDGRAIEEIGKYHPKENPSFIEVNSERAQYWLGVGAQPTEPVVAILKVTGDWQKFKGLPGAEGTLEKAEPKPERRAAYDAAVAEAHLEPSAEATTPRKKAAKKAPVSAAPPAAAEAAEAPVSAAAAPAAEPAEAPVDAAPAEAATPAEAAPAAPPAGAATDVEAAASDSPAEA